MPRSHPSDDTNASDLTLGTLWYRFLFFAWMFQDVNAARNVYEYHAAAQHNRYMCRYLPTYLRRWSWLTLASFTLGCWFEHAGRASMLSAWFFTWSCVTLTGMVVISVAWAFLAHPARR